MKHKFIFKHKPKYLAVKRACQAIGVSPSGYFKSLKRRPANLDLREETVQSAFRIHIFF